MPESNLIKRLDEEIMNFIENSFDQRDDHRFNHIALKVFEFQYNNIELYQRYCQRRGITPKNINNWTQIPAVPTDVFKVVKLFCPHNSKISKTFMTSGTTKEKERGKVYFDQGGLKLMDLSIKVNASHFLFPDNLKTKILILAPPPKLAPHMIMAYGMDKLKALFGLPGSLFLVNENGLDIRTFIESLRESESTGLPVSIMGGSSGFLNFFDFCIQKGISFRLPEGSRCMDAGGFKGKTRQIRKEDFPSYFVKIFSIPEENYINLLGMTELASQFYDNTLRNRINSITAPRFKVNPPWTRTVIVNPERLEPVKANRIGLLRHFDLANRGHILAIQTDDIGKKVNGGFEIYGRARSDESRGCSLTIEEMVRLI